MTPSLSPEKQFLRGPVFLFITLGFAAMYLGVMPTGIVGAACVLLPLALILEPFGDRVPILKD
jgi:Na+/citrate or Na+/malate symporter